MCAIAGMIHLFTDEAVCEKILETMKRRGPDAVGIYRDNDCTLLHARLSIIDPEGGSQPMELAWEGDRYLLVYNGELYNTKELLQELIKLGHCFSSHSDTEVVLHAYCQWGENCLQKMNGIFAFGVWSVKDKILFLARDRIGVKPLFYKLHGNGLLFASEIKSLLAMPGVDAELDAEGVAELLLIGPGRTPGCGVFRNILELEPGCCAYYRNRRLNVKRYWKLLDREHTDTFEETAAYTAWLVKDAIQRQMVSDVPIGTFLSGGLDSSLISAICATKMAESGDRLHCFSVDYLDNDKYFVPGKFQPNSDSSYIEIMKTVLPIEHHWTVLTPENLVDELENATVARDLPGMADVDFSLLAFCREIRRHVKVALSGECADEIFGGYPWYRDPEIREKEGFPWAQTFRQRTALLRPEILKGMDPESYVMDRYLQTCRESDILPGTSPEEKRIKEMVNLNFRWFMQTLLDRKDRMSMYSGLEVRVPFCDYRIAEYLYGVPWKFKDYGGVEKGLLRYAMEGILPKEVLWRKKSPYPKTHDPKYLQLVTDRMNRLLADKDAPLYAIVQPDKIKQLLMQENPWPWYGQLMRLPQTIAYLLQINFWLTHYNVRIL